MHEEWLGLKISIYHTEKAMDGLYRCSVYSKSKLGAESNVCFCHANALILYS